ncbi:sigma 54-interacting transcriptional regulator [Halanaerobium sp.]|uniref:sigma 54-interacting transcriptional regulator n=1 Tax=Halanaerobium sp. TaxID=1895664 RepID=UPI0025C629B4|nr:sigma-54-dependent transcriptional regulator [Halanaerobium sp.]
MVKEMTQDRSKGMTAKEVAKEADITRSTASRYLNKLVKEGKMKKTNSRPVYYSIIKTKIILKSKKLDNIIGADKSLKVSVQQAKAAILYPPNGLHTLLLGETGVGKSMFAELMYNFAVEEEVISSDAPFIKFNCADYTDNPQLLMGQLFGVKKGAYTGAEKDSKGFIKNADGGILFLDEIHRLPPQGQEMLFTFIDNGFFRKLGDTDEIIEADVKIIAATTEPPGSYLLKTFQRRIPMVIELPALSDRSLIERFQLIKYFIKQEQKRIGKDIYIYKNALKSFLLYDCTNNIGQLKSDIQLACAKAFLNFKSKQKNKSSCLKIGQEELPYHVKKGIMNLPNKREELDELIKNRGNLISFKENGSKTEQRQKDKKNKDYQFYDVIEDKMNTLEDNGLPQEEINQILNIDIEKHFKNYIGDLSANFKKSKIEKIVGEDIVSLVQEILDLAKNRLDRSYDEKIYYGLALHLKRSIARIRNDNKIYHPNLNEIRSEHSQEFITAMEIATIIDQKFSIKTPLDEIGYISMFLTEKPYNYGETDVNKVGILVVMHGKSTASSMTEVVNNLVGEEHAVAVDMPLEMSPNEAYKKAKAKAKEIDNGSGIIVMVDMGSLNSFGGMIAEETGIKTETITMVSTPTILEASRKAVLGDSFADIIESVNEIGGESYQQNFEVETERDNNLSSSETTNKNLDDFAIVTACYTGEGAARELKNIIENNLNSNLSYRIINLSLMEDNNLEKEIKKLEKEYNILAVVSTMPLELESVPYISALDILGQDGIEKLSTKLKHEEMIFNIKTSLKDQFSNFNSFKMVDDLRTVINNIESRFKEELDFGVKIGIIIHMAYMLENAKKDGNRKQYEKLNEFITKNKNSFAVVNSEMERLESEYNLDITDDEKAYITEMFLYN